MNPSITLIGSRGPLAGKKFVFREATRCVIGRSRDCTIALPLEAEHLDVSRRHCVLDIAPPELRVRDLGSLNGTYVNGRKIGQRDRRAAPTFDSPFAPVALTAGDEIQLGENTAFRVWITPLDSREADGWKPRLSSGELPPHV
jgi:pSer/pThr/pTyr-binding forkhead associated (FHA) protein